MDKTTLTLYDFLNYEIIGALMLLACNVKPDMINSWLYFLFAYVVGIIIVKLNENTIWSSLMRNPECIILMAKDNLTSTKNKPSLDSYFRDYYRVFEGKISDNIRTLEAQYAFVWNLIVPVCTYVFSFICKGGCSHMIKIGKNDVQICLFPIALTASILIIGNVISFIKEQYYLCVSNKAKRIQNNCKCKCFWLVCGPLILCVIEAVFLIYLYGSSFSSGNTNLIEQRIIGTTLGMFLFLLPYIAYCIQKKISTLVVEGAHYLQK